MSKSIPEAFNCCICIQTITNAVMCPHCSKMCCYDCVKTWIDSCNQSCPHCRQSLSLDDFVKCRWAQEVIEQWRLISDVPKDCPDLCELHDKKKKIFCSTCRVPVCQYCALWGEAHREHQFHPLEDVYMESRRGISSQLNLLMGAVKQFEAQAEQISAQILQVESAKVAHYKDIRNMVAKSFERLDEIELLRVNELNERAKQTRETIECLNRVVLEAEEKLNSLTYVQLIAEAGAIEGAIRRSMVQPEPLQSSEEVTRSLSSEYIPPFESKVFLMSNFSSLGKQPIFSEVLLADGLGWRLKVYPNGNGEVEGSFLSLFVELISGLRGSSRFDYKLELLNREESRSISRVYSSEFEVGECWGYTRFCRLSRLDSGGFINDDSLTFRLNVRCPTYYHKCLVLQKLLSPNPSYIQRLTDSTPSRHNRVALGVTNSGDVNDVCLQYKWDDGSHSTELTDDIFSDFSVEAPMDLGDIFDP